MDIPELEDLDYSLIEATLESIHTRTLTPILKEELRLKIQTNRLAAGKDELPRTVFKEPEKCELTEEEKIRRDHRREQNRVAAAKCRNKRKTLQESFNTALDEAELKNHDLKRKIEELEAQKEYFIKRLKQENAEVAESILQSFSSPSTTSEPVSCKKESYTHLQQTTIPEHSHSNVSDESPVTKVPPQFTPNSGSLQVFCPTFTQVPLPLASTSDLVRTYLLPQNTPFRNGDHNLTYIGHPGNHYLSSLSTSTGIYEPDYSISRRYSADTALHQRPVGGDHKRRLSEDVLQHLLYSTNTQPQSLSKHQVAESPCSTLLDECDLLPEVDFNTFVPVECPDIKSNFDSARVSDQGTDHKSEEDNLIDVEHFLDFQGDEAEVPGGERYDDFGLTSPSLY